MILKLSIEIPVSIMLADKDKAMLLKHLKKEALFVVSKLSKEKGDYCGWPGYAVGRNFWKAELP